MAYYKNPEMNKKRFQHWRFECMQTNYITNASHPEFLKQISERKKKRTSYRKHTKRFSGFFCFWSRFCKLQPQSLLAGF